MDMTLYRVGGTSGRITLGDLAKDVEFFSAERDTDTGVVILTPVKIVSGTSKRTTDTTTPNVDDDDFADV